MEGGRVETEERERKREREREREMPLMTKILHIIFPASPSV
jgi:hypothetical protein